MNYPYGFKWLPIGRRDQPIEKPADKLTASVKIQHTEF